MNMNTFNRTIEKTTIQKGIHKRQQERRRLNGLIEGE